MKRVGLAAVALIAIAGVVAAVLMSRDPWAGLDAPQGFLLSGSRVLTSVEGPETTITEEEYGLFAGLMQSMADQMNMLAGEGYALFDPATGRVTFHIAGTEMGFILPEPDVLAPMETEGTGVGPAFIRREGRALRLSVIAPIEGLGDDVAIALDFEAAADVSAQQTKQAEVAAAQRAAEAAWRDAMVPVEAAIAAGPAFEGMTSRVSLPGWQGAITVPLWAYFGNWADFPRTEFEDVAGQKPTFTVIAQRPGLGETTIAAERDRLLEGAEAQRRVLRDEPGALIVARMGQPITAIFQRIVGDIDYVTFVETDDSAAIREVWAAAESLSDAPLGMQPVLADDFDALGWMAARGTAMIPKEDLTERFGEGVADMMTPAALMGQVMDVSFDLSVEAALTEGGFPHFLERVTCTPEIATGAPLSAAHERLIAAAGLISYADFGHMTKDIGAHVRSGKFAREEPFAPDLSTERPRWEPVWHEDTAQRAVGVEGPLHYVYFARPLGQFALICGVAHEDPLVLRMAEQMAMALDLPEIAPISDEVIAQLRAYRFASAFGPDLFKVKADNDAFERLIRPDGTIVLEGPYDWYTWHGDAGVITAENEADKEGLWLPDGTRLLPNEYDDFQVARDKGPGLISARKDGEWRLYSVPDRRFVEAAD
ncbi:MAG: hypothetical protein AAF367_03055 [Pseudomonadota bacterium]